MACVFASLFALSIRARAAQAPDVTAQLKAAKTGTRADAVQAVLDHRGRASAEALTAAAGTEANPEIRLRLLMAAFEVDRSSGMTALIAALGKDASPLVRGTAAQILLRAGPDPTARRALLGCLSGDADLTVRRSCASALGSHQSPEAVKALIGLAADPDAELRRRAGLALLRQPRSAAVDQALDRFENDSDRTVGDLIRARRRAARGETP